MTDKPIQIDPSPFIPVLVQIVTKLLVAAGTFLVAHGLATDDQIAAGVPVLAQEIVGAALALGAAAYASWRSKRNNQNTNAILDDPRTYVPTDVAVKKGSTNA
jgi:hypothetical protein